jgi:hypothetical protein
MPATVVGLFDTIEQAQQTVQDLLSLYCTGLSRADLCVRQIEVVFPLRAVS